MAEIKKTTSKAVAPKKAVAAKNTGSSRAATQMVTAGKKESSVSKAAARNPERG